MTYPTDKITAKQSNSYEHFAMSIKMCNYYYNIHASMAKQWSTIKHIVNCIINNWLIEQNITGN